MSRGLLRRLSAPEEAPPSTGEAVLAHLRVLLNSRQGEAPSNPGFGVVDFADVVHSFPDAIQTLQKLLRATIAEHEPRLRNVTVRAIKDDDPLVVRFEVTAQLAEGARGTLRFRTQMTAGGRFEVG